MKKSSYCFIIAASISLILFCTGEGWAQPAISVNPTSLNFSGVGLNCSVTKTFRINSVGTQVLQISNISLQNNYFNVFAFSGPSLPASAQPGNYIQVSVTFSPKYDSIEAAQIQIISNAPTSPTTVFLTGDGYGAEPCVVNFGDIDVTPVTIDFGYVGIGDPDFGQMGPIGAGNPKEIQIFNTGSGPLRISDIYLTDTLNYEVKALGIAGRCPNPPFTLSCGDSCIFLVRFSPTSTGNHMAFLRIASDDPDENPFSVSLKGTAPASNWEIQTIGPGVQSVDIAVDKADDSAHLCYFTSDGAVMYATNRSGEWATEAIASFPQVGSDCAMAIGDDSKIHMAFVAAGGLYYAVKGTTGPWTVKGIDVSLYYAEGNCSIALYNNEIPYIGFQTKSPDETERYLNVAYLDFSAGFWRSCDIDSSEGAHDSFIWHDIAFPPLGDNLWVTYQKKDPIRGADSLQIQEMRIYSCDRGGLFHYELSGRSIHSNRLGITSHLTYPFNIVGLNREEGSVNQMRFNHNAPDGGIFPTLDYFAFGQVADNNDLHLSQASTCYPICTQHIAFYDAKDKDLKYFMQYQDIWYSAYALHDVLEKNPQITEKVDTEGDVGRSAEIALDSSAWPHIAYLDSTNNSVKYARRLGATGKRATISPTRVQFKEIDTQPFTIYNVGKQNVTVSDIRIESQITDFGIRSDCSSHTNSTIAPDGYSVICVVNSVPAPGSTAFLIVETDAGTLRAELFGDELLFMDVPFGYWAYEFIIAIYQAGITLGCSQDPLLFCPEDSVTREQMATFIIRAMGQDPPANYCDSGIPFSDVAADLWSCRFIKTLKELGITAGYQDGSYGPADRVSREQMAAFLIRALGEDPPANYCESGVPFSDVTEDMWSCPSIKRLKEMGITSGYPDGRYGPNDLVTRVQMAIFLQRSFLDTP